MVIAGYPDTDDTCLKVYDSRGNPLEFAVK